MAGWLSSAQRASEAVPTLVGDPKPRFVLERLIQESRDRAPPYPVELFSQQKDPAGPFVGYGLKVRGFQEIESLLSAGVNGIEVAYEYSRQRLMVPGIGDKHDEPTRLSRQPGFC